MTSRSGERGRAKIARHLLAAGLMLSTGYVFGLFTLGGCGGLQVGFAPPADGRLPEHVVDKLTDCTQRGGPTALQTVGYTVSFDVFMDSDGQVENVALRQSTFHIDEVEACMGSALRALSERPMDASLRRREPASPASLPSETRGLFANPMVLGAGAAQAVLVVGFLMVTVVVYYQVVRNTQTHRPPPPRPLVADPPKPEPPKPEPQTAGDPKTTGPTPPLPPPRPPPEPKDCFRNESFFPIRTDNAMGCTDKNGKPRCYSRRHRPCAGVHTHGKLSYQKIRNGVCKTIERDAVRCEGLFKVSGQCGSVPTVECWDGGPETSGIHEE